MFALRPFASRPSGSSSRAAALRRPWLSMLVTLPLLAGTAGARDFTADFTGVPHRQLVEGLSAPAAPDAVSIVTPIIGQTPAALGTATITLRPTQCRRAFGNALGALYACEWRSALVERAPAAGAFASRHRVALWQAASADRAAAFVFYDLDIADDDKALLKAVKQKRFGIVPLTPAQWSTSVQPGHHDASATLAMDSAATAAIEAMGRGGEYKPLHAVEAPSAEQAVVWGDLRVFGEVLIQKLDGKTMWHMPLNGYAQAVTTTPGAHRLDVVVIAAAGSPRDYEQPLDVELAAGHTYVVDFGIDDKPRIADLGTGVRCERRKHKTIAAASYHNAWLACAASATAPAAAAH